MSSYNLLSDASPKTATASAPTKVDPFAALRPSATATATGGDDNNNNHNNKDHSTAMVKGTVVHEQPPASAAAPARYRISSSRRAAAVDTAQSAAGMAMSASMTAIEYVVSGVKATRHRGLRHVVSSLGAARRRSVQRLLVKMGKTTPSALEPGFTDDVARATAMAKQVKVVRTRATAIMSALQTLATNNHETAQELASMVHNRSEQLAVYTGQAVADTRALREQFASAQMGRLQAEVMTPLAESARRFADMQELIVQHANAKLDYDAYVRFAARATRTGRRMQTRTAQVAAAKQTLDAIAAQIRERSHSVLQEAAMATAAFDALLSVQANFLGSMASTFNGMPPAPAADNAAIATGTAAAPMAAAGFGAGGPLDQ